VRFFFRQFSGALPKCAWHQAQNKNEQDKQDGTPQEIGPDVGSFLFHDWILNGLRGDTAKVDTNIAALLPALVVRAPFFNDKPAASLFGLPPASQSFL
jgi:hypothetical protein